jgi:transposase
MACPAAHHTPEARTARTRAERPKDRRLAVADLAAPEKNAAESGAHLVLIDESGAHLTPLVRRSLAPRGQTPILKTPGRKRQKVSMIAALSMAPRRNRIGLYFRCFPDHHVTQVEAAQFVRDLLKHLRGPVHVVWDRGNTHKGDAIRALHRDYPRLTGHWFPPYAPELNPVEYVWNHAKFGRGANYLPRDLAQLHQWLERLLSEARDDPQRKISFFDQAGLPLRSRTLAS